MTRPIKTDRNDRINRLLVHPVAKLAVPLVISVVAFFVLHRLASEISWQEVKLDMTGAPKRALLAAVCLTIVSFAALALYDVLAVEIVAKGKVPRRVAAMTGAAGAAITNFLGASWLTGSSLRFRVYSAQGLDWTSIAGILATAWFATLLGMAFVTGFAMVVRPMGIGTVFGLAPNAETAFGVAVLIAIAGLFIWLSLGRRTITFRDFRMTLASPRLAAMQIGIVTVDILAASLVLYVLMPADLTQNFGFFLVVYLAAIGGGLLSHAPGGVGVFEAIIIAGLGATGRSDVLAGLLLYRLIYTVLPFTLAVLAIAGLVVRPHLGRVGETGKALHAALRPMIAPVSAAITLLSGFVLMLSGSIPSDTGRLGLLRDILPLPFIEASHLVASIIGVLLVVISRGLFRRQFRAWLAAIVLLCAGLVASFLKGVDLEEAAILAASLAVLLLFRPIFYRAMAQRAFQLSVQWGFGAAVLIVAAIWVGLLSYSHVPYRNELWWEFAWHGDASRFLRASLAIAVIFMAIGLNSIINGAGKRLPPEPIPARVLDLVAMSPTTDANIALTGDKRFLVSGDGSGFLAYADTGGSLIAYADPVGPRETGETVIWQFRDLADQMGRHCAFYSVSSRYLPTFLDMGFAVLKIGEVGRIDLTTFTLDGPKRKDFRYAQRRARREGYVFEVVAAADLAPILPELRGVSKSWLASKHGREKGFSLGSFDEDYLSHFDHAILRKAENGAIIAFANLFQGADHNELSFDLMRHVTAAPGFVMDALFAEILLWGKAQGFRWFSLGATPFAGLEDHPLATTWNRFGSFIYQHGERFYNFEGLRSFKEKFDPEWTPTYLVSPRGLQTPRVLYDVNLLVSGGVRGLALEAKNDD
ncbi:Phosphatidylglycerol lysyltransferase [Roseovarius litorisediminis]|uniref:Phosphatidylglycerol lysyltransferase n=1 Tax=Roseovarius litorisediminis TaxID=1312363 RepID=A0A1Y5S686_9RHOB|nr:bifunctional lysylphosphatidylglycerol flippase/synthetase MprF [Roseovarius litorisediminis]SLN30688.1 Phosphatidylglycerol lysyltransferase [Roseovarius litorisediminis]